MKATYISHMGDDQMVVNAARVSFRKYTEDFTVKDWKLINYLAKHNHWTPFGHPQVCIHLKMPFFVARQIDKHQTGFVVNEVSRRYVDDEPEFYSPEMWRKRPEDGIKQGSSDTPVDEPFASPFTTEHEYIDYMNGLHDFYSGLIDHGVAPELARMVLPMSTYTEQYKTGSLAAWARLYNLRIDSHAQRETQELAKQIGKIMEPLFPVSWEALTKESA